jgi:hypothetical protein
VLTGEGLSIEVGFDRRGTTMVVRFGGWGGWLQAQEASGGQCGPQGGGGLVREGPEVAIHGEVLVEEGGGRLTASAIFGVQRCLSRLNEGLVTGVAWHMGTVVLEATLIGSRWWLAVPRRVGSRATEQSERWGARRGGEGIGFDLQCQIRRGG